MRTLFLCGAAVLAAVCLLLMYRQITAHRRDAAASPPVMPAGAVLLSLNWTQTGGESADGSFAFALTAESGACILSDGENSISLTDAQRQRAEQCLRTGEHRAPAELPEGVEVLDAVESTLSVTWRTADGQMQTAVYDGRYETALRHLLAGLLAASAR